MAVPPKTGRTRLHCFKTLQLSQSFKHWFKCQLWALRRMSFKLRTTQKSRHSYVSRTKLQPFVLAHYGLNQIATSWLHGMLGNSQNCWQHLFLPSPNFFHICTKSTATPTSQGNSALNIVIFTGHWNSKTCCGRPRNLSVVTSQVPQLHFRVAIFPVSWATCHGSCGNSVSLDLRQYLEFGLSEIQ